MNINRNNYELFFLDYHEGRLEPGQVAELLVFLESHPELQEEFEDFEDITIAPDLSVSFADKSSLKKNNVIAAGPINASNYKTYFITAVENQLTKEEQLWFAGFLGNNPGLSGEYELYLSTRLEPEMLIQYPGKAGLKRSVLNTRRFYYYALSTAASLALLFAVFMYSETKQEPILTARQKTLTVPSAKNKNEIQAFPPKEVSKQASASKTNRTGNTLKTDQQQYGALAYVETHYRERKEITGIRSRSDAFVSSRNIVKAEYTFIRRNRNRTGTYSNLYDQINLAERMQNEQVLAPVVSSPKSIFSSGLHKLTGIFTGREAPSNLTTINFWSLAELGISGYNLLTDKDLKLLTQSNDSGKVVSYALKGDEFEFIRQQNKPKNP